MDRQALIFLPTLNCPYVFLQMSGNFLPGIEPLSAAYARVSPRVLHDPRSSFGERSDTSRATRCGKERRLANAAGFRIPLLRVEAYVCIVRAADRHKEISSEPSG
jgi:hypothetical protein